MEFKELLLNNKDPRLVEWNENLSVGIPAIDRQHMALLRITNELFLACLDGETVARESFKETVHKAVQYVRNHFLAEEALLEKVNYPRLTEHRAQHEAFVRELLTEVKDFEAGIRFIPNSFVRFLRDWVLTHIAIADQDYGLYCAKRAAEGFVIPEVDKAGF